MKKLTALVVSAAFVSAWGLSLLRAQDVPTVPTAAGLKAIDEYTLAGDKNLISGYRPRSESGMIQVVVEIPTGTNAKWEVSKPDGQLKWEFKNGKPRVVKYLAYPGNYGMIPRTLLSKELGGDGDPLDVLVLGPAVPRGSIVKAKLIGILKLLDGGEQDDKLLAVIPGTPLGKVDDMAELNAKFPGATKIVEIWFANYKGPGKTEVRSFGDVGEANKILDAAIKQYQTAEQ